MREDEKPLMQFDTLFDQGADLERKNFLSDQFDTAFPVSSLRGQRRACAGCEFSWHPQGPAKAFM
jgi:hypothetical protein